ncbi:MAG: flagellar basal body rod protein FlgB [Thermodesulfobacteriota bacterium]
MAENILFGSTIGMLEQALNLRSQNHEMLSSNIANADTPGYAARHLNFEEQLRQAYDPESKKMEATHENHFGVVGKDDPVEGEVKVNHGGAIEENGVRMEREMAMLSENQIKYEAAARMLSRKFASLEYVIREASKV